MVGSIHGDTFGVEKQGESLIAETVLGHAMQDKENTLYLPLIRNPNAILYRFPIAAIQLPDCSHRPLPVLFIFI
jgi:hypothetical protein